MSLRRVEHRRVVLAGLDRVRLGSDAGLAERSDDDRRSLVVRRGLRVVEGDDRSRLAGLGDQLLGQLRVAGVRDLLPEHRVPHTGRCVVKTLIGLDDTVGQHTGEIATGVLEQGCTVDRHGDGLADLLVRHLHRVDGEVAHVGVECTDRTTFVLSLRLRRAGEHDTQLLGLELQVNGRRVVARTLHDALVDDLRVDAIVNFPRVREGAAVGVR